MLDRIKVSIIMPSFNVVNYIEQAISSVVNQSLEDIEIICVDAGSNDGTLDVIHRYVEKDDRVRLIISDKKSYGYQMNLGIRAARGEYVGIVETDDYIKLNMYETLYTVARRYTLDFVKSDYEKFWWDEDNTLYVSVAPTEKLYNHILTDDYRAEFFRYSSLNWTGIYRRQYLLDNDIWHSDTPGASYQDIGFWLQNMSFAKRAMWIPQAFYMYRQDNPASSMKSRGKIYCSLDEYRRVLAKLRERNCNLAYKECLMLKTMDYRVTFNRIEDALKREYVETISDEYAIDKPIIDTYEHSYAEVIYLSWLEKLLFNTEEICNELIKAARLVRERLDNCPNIYLYGAGMIAQKCFERLYSAGYWDKVKSVIVSGDTTKEFFFARNICSLDQLISYDLSATDLVILGLGERNQKEVRELLEQYGIDNIMIANELETLMYVI